MEPNDDLMEWVEVDGIKYATQQEVAWRIRELEAELRQQQSEPVAYLEPDRHFPAVVHANEAHVGQKSTWIPLYREAAPRVPEGWKMVPVEPTEEMAKEYWTFNDRTDVVMADAWKAMLAAAPEPKEKE